MSMEVLPSLAKRRLTDFFEGAGENGRRETLYALFWGRRLMVLLVSFLLPPVWEWYGKIGVSRAP